MWKRRALRLEDLENALARGPKLVAVGYASNALGTINPVRKIVDMAHQAGALVYIDAVQYAPHGPIDVQALDCDFLVCSAYKIFGPHIGMLYGRYELLDRLQAFRVRPAPADPPGKFETGTGNFEGYAGWLGALGIPRLAGRCLWGDLSREIWRALRGAGPAVKQAMAAIRAYEFDLSRAFIENLKAVPGLQLYGQDDLQGVEGRVPTFAFTLRGHTPREVAAYLDSQGIYAWDGNYYALAVTERLGLEGRGGMVRVGAVHYNRQDEVERLGAALQTMG